MKQKVPKIFLKIVQILVTVPSYYFCSNNFQKQPKIFTDVWATSARKLVKKKFEKIWSNWWSNKNLSHVSNCAHPFKSSNFTQTYLTKQLRQVEKQITLATQSTLYVSQYTCLNAPLESIISSIFQHCFGTIVDICGQKPRLNLVNFERTNSSIFYIVLLVLQTQMNIRGYYCKYFSTLFWNNRRHLWIEKQHTLVHIEKD